LQGRRLTPPAGVHKDRPYTISEVVKWVLLAHAGISGARNATFSFDTSIPKHFDFTENGPGGPFSGRVQKQRDSGMSVPMG